MIKFWNEQTLIIKFAIVTLTIGFIIFLTGFLIKPAIEGLYFWKSTDYEKSGQIGDFAGGIVGTLFAFAGTIFIVITFREQNIENRRKRFEEIFYEMIRIHRENVSQMIYKKPNLSANEEIINRQVIKEIVYEFKELYGDIKKLTKRWELEKTLSEPYRSRTEKIISSNSLRTSVIEMAIIDLAYFILFYGLSQDGKVIVEGKFKKIIEPKTLKIILFYLEQKPKKSNEARYCFWKELKSMESKKILNTVLHSYGMLPESNNYDVFISKRITSNRKEKPKYDKYYGGHQHRLGHYYRHLYQAYKTLDRSILISEETKYEYSKLLRAQLSTYEQILLFINSISSLGMKWQLILDKNEKNNFIENYHVIKNVPGIQLYDLKYKNFYPKVEYEFMEQ
jgi:hypothetical protein